MQPADVRDRQSLRTTLSDLDRPLRASRVSVGSALCAWSEARLSFRHRQAQKPRVWLLLAFLPIINIILFVPVAKNFGKSGGYAVGLGLLPVIFWPMLGFGSDQYRGPPVED